MELSGASLRVLKHLRATASFQKQARGSEARTAPQMRDVSQEDFV